MAADDKTIECSKGAVAMVAMKELERLSWRWVETPKASRFHVPWAATTTKLA